MSTPVISVENLSKAYRIGHKEEIPDTLVAAATGWLKAPLRNWQRLRRLNTFVESQESGDRRQEAGGSDQLQNPQSAIRNPQSDILWALRDVSFDVHEGEVVGIIGRNGAGKSTLLKILSRITEPTSGRAIIRGRVSSLLEVGTGFHPELTGRENIYMNGTILGMRKKEIDRKFDEIVEFSGVEKFLDTPTKRYSSGMTVRLAFAVAAHLEPEILIIDEVLAVGDAEFQRKCLGKMQDVARGGRTVLFVSHNMAAVETLCTRGVLLKDGRNTDFNDITFAIQSYISTTHKKSQAAYFADSNNDSCITLRSAHISTQSSDHAETIFFGEPFDVHTAWQHAHSVPNLSYAIRVFDARDLLICVANTISCPQISIHQVGTYFARCRFEPNILPPGSYRLAIGAFTRPYGPIADIDDCLVFDVLESPHHRSRPFTAANRPAAAAPFHWEVLSTPPLSGFHKPGKILVYPQ